MAGNVLPARVGKPWRELVCAWCGGITPLTADSDGDYCAWCKWPTGSLAHNVFGPHHVGNPPWWHTPAGRELMAARGVRYGADLIPQPNVHIGDHVSEPLGPAREWVDDRYPYFGWSGEKTSGAAAAVAELIRYINHATYQVAAAPTPGDAGRTLIEFGRALHAMPQAIGQLMALFEIHSVNPAFRLSGHDGDAARSAAGDVIARATTVAAAIAAIAPTVETIGYHTERFYLELPPETGDDD